MIELDLTTFILAWAIASSVGFWATRCTALDYKHALDEIEESLKPVCESCKEYYYNQHCENCDTGYIKDIISNVKELQ